MKRFKLEEAEGHPEVEPKTAATRAPFVGEWILAAALCRAPVIAAFVHPSVPKVGR